jgi:hypothetical protein
MVSKKPKPSGQQKKSGKNKSGDKLDSDLTAEENFLNYFTDFLQSN